MKADDCDDQKAEDHCCGYVSIQNMEGGKTNVASRCLKNRMWNEKKLGGYKYNIKGCPNMKKMKKAKNMFKLFGWMDSASLGQTMGVVSAATLAALTVY